jgi:hypothetical protein
MFATKGKEVRTLQFGRHPMFAGTFNGDIPQQSRGACAIAALQNEQI